MKRKLRAYVFLTCIAHILIAVGSFAAMRLAERSGWLAFSALERGLVFSDVPLYFEHANRAFAGQIPYRDDPIEYPVLALPFLYAPRLIARMQPSFVMAFAAEMLLFDAALVWLVARRAACDPGPLRVPAALAWLTAFYAGVAPFVMGRYDAVPAVLGFAAACGWFGGRPFAGGALAAVGTLVKIAPGAVAVPGLIRDALNLRERRPRGTIAFAAVLVVGVAGWFALGGSGVLASIRYHSGRGLEVGSVPSGLLWAWSGMMGHPARLVYDHQSLNLDAPGAGPLARMALPIQGALLATVAVGFVLRRGRDPFRAAGAAVLAFAIGGKVLSPQYLIWVMPFLAAMPGRAGRWGRPPFLVASVLTGLLYPWAFGGLAGLRPWACLALNARNLALASALIALVVCPSGEPEGSPIGLGPED